VLVRGLETVRVLVTLDGELVGTDGGRVNGKELCKDEDVEVLGPPEAA